VSHQCHAEGCEETAAHQWLRRATDAEWAQIVARAHERWAESKESLATFQNGQPVYPPRDVFVPRDGVALHVVMACEGHTPMDPDGERLAESVYKIHHATCVPPCKCTDLE